MFLYENNIFTKIAKKEIDTKIILENEFFMSFYDIKPITPIHILIISKNYYVNYKNFLLNSSEQEKKSLNDIIKDLIEKFSLNDFKLNTNNGKKAGQEIFHFHMHLMGM